MRAKLKTLDEYKLIMAGFLLGIACLVLSLKVNPANAAQIIEVMDDIEVRAYISPHSLNRIKIQGGSIDDIAALQGDLVSRKVDGEVYVNLPGGKNDDEITTWVFSKSGIKFRLLLKPINTYIRGQQIFLVEQHSTDDKLKIYENYSDKIISFYRGLYSGNIDSKAYKEVHKKKKSKKDKLRIIRKVAYEPVSGSGFYGEVFEIKNKSKTPKIIEAKDFYKPGVRAVKLDSTLLGKNETTLMYVISIRG